LRSWRLRPRNGGRYGNKEVVFMGPFHCDCCGRISKKLRFKIIMGFWGAIAKEGNYIFNSLNQRKA
jgi:hypothetical protein